MMVSNEDVMRTRVKKVLLFTAIFLVALSTLWLVGQNLLLSFLVGKVEDQLYSLRDAGYMVRYDSIKLNWADNKVEVFNLSVRRALDTLECKPDHFIHAKYILADDIGLLSLIFKKKLVFQTIRVDSAHLVFHDSYFKGDSVSSNKKSEFSIKINELQLPGISVEVLSKDQCETPFKYTSDIFVQNFALAFHEDEPAFATLDRFLASNVTMVNRSDLYTFKVASVNIDLSMHLADIDTIRIIPHYGKHAFSRKRGYQTDRMEGMIPYVNLYGLNLFRKTDTVGVEIKKLTTQVLLTAYRDKRVPHKRDYKKLPIEQLNSLPFGLKVDSLILNKSFIQYEEFPEGADSAGHVAFNDLYASIANVNNSMSGRNASTTLIANASFMGKGHVHLKAVFPTNPKERHEVSGYVTNFNFTDLNPMLEPSLGLKAESGKLQKLSFSFEANSLRADGKIQMTYSDLKVVSFRDKPKKGFIQRLFDTDDDEKQKAGLKTFIINHFVLRTERTPENVSETRSGDISFNRNTSKYIFNFWWKSVGSGIKSAYKIDKLEESKLVEALKKKDKG